MSKKKGNAADLAPSRKEKKGIGQYVLGFFLLLYTLFCFLPVLLVFIASFTDEASILKNGFSYFPEKWSMATVLIVIGPIMVVYPFFQKYFIKGLTVGSDKG